MSSLTTRKTSGIRGADRAGSGNDRKTKNATTIVNQRFTATIYKIGINPMVDVPLRVSRAFGKRGNIPVAGTLNRTGIRATLVPLGGGRHRLFIHGGMRKRAQVDVGSRITVVLHPDTRPRRVPMSPAFAGALRKSPTATVAWKLLTPSRRKEILRYLNSLKSPEALHRNVRKVMAVLSRTPGVKRVLWGIRMEKMQKK
jgi:hypothetical protein